MPDQEKKSSSDATRRSSGALPPLRNPPLPSLPSLPPPASRAPAYPSSRAPAYPPSSALGYPSGAASAAGTGAQAGQSSPFSTFQPPATQSTMERPVELTSSLIPGREEEFRTHYQTYYSKVYRCQWGDNDAATLEHWGGIMDLKTQCDLRLLNRVAEEMNITISQARTLYNQIIRPQPRSWPDPFAPETFIVNF